MTCEQILTLQDDYFDHLLTDQAYSRVTDHISSCHNCYHKFEEEQHLRESLRAITAPDPADDFLDNAFNVAAQANSVKTNRWRWGSGGAIAAVLALFVAINIINTPLNTPINTGPDDNIAGLSIALHETRKVSLVFNSKEALAHANFTIMLPDGIELSGFPDQQEVKWQGQLALGENLLVLPLVAKSRQGGEVVALVEHNNKHKTFRLQMNIKDGIQSFQSYTPKKIA